MKMDQKTLNRTVLSSLIGATIEWYDFFLFGVMAGVVLNKLYFPSTDPTISLMLAYATFAVGFISRPLGGIVFGHFGDKVGRKSVLVITLMIMGISTFLVGCIPTYDQIGLWAPALLLTLRVLQGIGLGGEWGGAVLMAYESAPEEKRGFYTSIPQMGLSIGILLASGSLALLSALMSDEAFMAWGWRICFLASFMLVLVGMWIRTRLFETPEFAAVKESHKEAKLPIVEMFKKDSGKVLLGLGARHVDGVFFNVFSVFSVSYLISTIGISRNDALIAVMVGGAVLTVCIPIAGHLSDKMSRAKLYAVACLVSALSVFPAFYGLQHSAGNTGLMWASIVIPYGILYSAVYGNVAAFQCDLFEAKVRYTGISFVYQMTSVVAGMTALISTALVKMNGGQPWLVCWYVVLSGLLSAGCAWAISKRNAAQESGRHSSVRSAAVI
jgi:metabolite-proton symporter